MTVFIINKIIEFDNESLTLTLCDDVNTQLSIPGAGARLLTLLIKENGKIVSKESILYEVWEREGYAPSTNNLYHYMSLIRRLLSDLGVSNVIKTVAKVGFILETEISIQHQENKYLFLKLDEVPQEAKIIKVIKKFDLAFINSLIISKKLTIIWMLFLFFVCCIIISSNYNGEINKPMTTLKQCNVYSLDKNGKNQRNQEAISTINFFNIDCNVKSNLYYSNTDNYTMIYYCPININDGMEKNCLNLIKGSKVSL